MIDADDLEDECERLAKLLRSAGYTVSLIGTVDPEAAAEVLDRAPGTLRNWRAAGYGPPYVRGRRVRYRLADLILWQQEQHEEPAIDRECT